MKEKRGARGIRFSGAGTALLLMLFFVLCLTILCSLSLLSAASDMKLANAHAASVKSYYEADAKATRVLHALLRLDLGKAPAAVEDTAVTVEEKSDLYLVRYHCGAGENQALNIKVFLDNAGRYRVEEWKLLSTLSYDTDGHIDVFGSGPDE
ncbi:MAG TPA: hypothetical protein VN512_05700 [Clostridia bacterium]|nr:hypothetical protein [Clostridia bacterium]